MTATIERVSAVVDIPEPDPNGHVWELDWMCLDSDGWRCALCLTPGYRRVDAGSACRKADRLPILRAYSRVAVAV